MPITGDFKGHLGPNKYQSSYSHDEETVFPGYHQVKLKDYGINVELTSTTRVGFHKYTFEKNGIGSGTYVLKITDSEGRTGTSRIIFN